MEGRKLRLSDLPEHILIYILSKLPAKDVARSCLLASKWQHLWKSVPVSLSFDLPKGTSEKNIADFRISTNRELRYWRSCQKIGTFSVSLHRYKKRYVKDDDLWVHFSAKVANVECFELKLICLMQDLLLRFTNEDEHIRRFETHNFDGSLPHLKTIKIINYYGLLSEDNFVPSFVKSVLNNATTLEKFVIAAGNEEHEMSQDVIFLIQVAEELLSFPRT